MALNKTTMLAIFALEDVVVFHIDEDAPVTCVCVCIKYIRLHLDM